MKPLLFVLSWWFLTLGSVITSAYLVTSLYQHAGEPVMLSAVQDTAVVAANTSYGSGVGQIKGVETSVETEDARAELVSNFLERHSSPLTPYDEYGHKIVAIADRYNLDFRLLPAIAMQESNLCKRIPEGSFNCLGFGIHSKGTLTFDSYEANFERAARELKKNYIDRGLTTPAEIMTKYTPHSNGSWAESVNQWMSEMRYDDRSKGRELKTDADLLEFVTPSPMVSTPVVTSSGTAATSSTATPTAQ